MDVPIDRRRRILAGMPAGVRFVVRVGVGHRGGFSADGPLDEETRKEDPHTDDGGQSDASKYDEEGQ